MLCPFCGEADTKVVDSRLVADGSQVRRRRECQACTERFTSYESAELAMPKVIKQDGTRVPFDEDKLRLGMVKALEKRPVPVEAIEAALHRLYMEIRASGEREVKSQLIGQMIMEALQELDQVAYVRFASVYRSFEDVSEFKTEIDRLQQAKKSKPNGNG